jgi:hypothetical protein
MPGSNPEDVVGGSTVDTCDVFLMYCAPPKARLGDLASAVSSLIDIGIQRYLSCSRMSSIL